TGIVRGHDYCFLSAIDKIEALDPSEIEAEQDPSVGAKRTLVYLEAHLRRLLPRNGALYLGQHGAFNPYQYQLLPAARALHKIRPRILIGDAVGLGKTIECGILLSELIRRGCGRRILCAVPKATLEQFQGEMWGRFSIPLHRLDSAGIQRLRQDLPSTMNPFFHHDKVIISLDTLKIDTYRRNIEDCEWDVVVIDEAHNVANRTDGLLGSKRHQVARRLADRARALILLSATPHDGTPFGFSSLIKLIDRAAVANDDAYTLDEIKPHFIRRTRSRVTAQLGKMHGRRSKILEVPLSKHEAHILDSIHNLKLEHANSARGGTSGFRELFTTTLIKSFLSSPHALAETLERKIKNLRDPKTRFFESAERDARQLEEVLQKIDLKESFSRLTQLKSFIASNPVSADERIVIFTERLATLNAIRDFFIKENIVQAEFNPKIDIQAKGNLVACADGSLSDRDLTTIVKAFQNSKSGIRILIASNVASEGLNLHTTCHKLVHFDLPWSFITLEQRNGRIDRLGQTRVPEITYFASKVSAEDEKLKDDFWIVRKLRARIDVAARDLEEDSLAQGLTDGATEEAINTERFQQNKLDSEEAIDPILALIAGSTSNSDSEVTGGEELYTKQLATLFPGAPKAFVLTAAELLGIETEQRESAIDLKLTPELRREAKTWPREFRPRDEDKSLVLESSVERMTTYYLNCIRNAEEIRRSFLNEIHPAIALLEDAALHLFPGKKIPMVSSSKTPKGDTVVLCQGTLFNNLNEPVFQAWEAISFSSGSAKARPIFGGDLFDNERLHRVADWVRMQCESAQKKKVLTDENKLAAIAEQSISKMLEVTNAARDKRSTSLREVLANEARRVQAWKKSRELYLNQLKNAGSKSFVTAEIRARAEHAKRELQGMETEYKNLNDFINKSLATNSQPDIQILAVFVGV
ncbi:MAG: hypothetical protein RL189_2854, partial [Pseudomonadota bacterium]